MTWTEWKGGECPVEPETVVEVKTRKPGMTITGPASFSLLKWAHEGDSFDVVAYREAEQPKAKETLHEALRQCGWVVVAVAMIGVCGDMIRDTYNGEVKWLASGWIILAVAWTMKKFATRTARKEAK